MSRQPDRWNNQPHTTQAAVQRTSASGGVLGTSSPASFVLPVARVRIRTEVVPRRGDERCLLRLIRQPGEFGKAIGQPRHRRSRLRCIACGPLNLRPTIVCANAQNIDRAFGRTLYEHRIGNRLITVLLCKAGLVKQRPQFGELLSIKAAHERGQFALFVRAIKFRVQHSVRQQHESCGGHRLRLLRTRRMLRDQHAQIDCQIIGYSRQGIICMR